MLTNNDTIDAGDMRDERTINVANEIEERNLVAQTYPTPEVPEREPVYDGVGNLVRDDTDESTSGFKYEYDVLGRLTRIRENTSGADVVAEFRYDARNHRTMWRHPKRTGISNGEGREDLAARWHYAVYDDRWRIVEVYRDERDATLLGEPSDIQYPPTSDTGLSRSVPLRPLPRPSSHPLHPSPTPPGPKCRRRARAAAPREHPRARFPTFSFPQRNPRPRRHFPPPRPPAPRSLVPPARAQTRAHAPL